MARNITLNPGTGGSVVNTYDRAGVETQIVAIDLNPAGSETLMAGAMPVTGTFWQATQPVSLAASVTVVGTGTFVTQAAQSGTWNVGTVTTLTGITNVVHVDDNSGSLTVDGTVTANAGTGTFAVSAASLPLPSGASTAAKQPALGTAGTASSDVLTVQGIASMTAIKVDGSAVTQPVSGTFWQATQPVSGTFWQATQPVSGTVTANIGTSGSLALDATLTGGTQKSKLVDSAGTNVATVSAGGALKVDASATTQPVSLASLPALVAGTALIGQTAASNETGTVYSGTTALTPKFAIITASSSGATTVVAAVTGKKIRVLRWRVSANGSVNIKWQSHVTPTDKSGLSYGTQYKDCGGGYCPVGHFETVSGEALDINLSAAVAVSGELTYIEV
jgi:hypothetical protein